MLARRDLGQKGRPLRSGEQAEVRPVAVEGRGRRTMARASRQREAERWGGIACEQRPWCRSRELRQIDPSASGGALDTRPWAQLEGEQAASQRRKMGAVSRCSRSLQIDSARTLTFSSRTDVGTKASSLLLDACESDVVSQAIARRRKKPLTSKQGLSRSRSSFARSIARRCSSSSVRPSSSRVTSKAPQAEAPASRSSFLILQ